MSKTKDELLDEAAEAGVEADESMTNAEIQAAIDGAASGGGEDAPAGDYDPSKFAGVSPDRQFPAAEAYDNPVETEWEVTSREAYQAQIDEANAEKEEGYKAAEELAEKTARQRLTDLLGK